MIKLLSAIEKELAKGFVSCGYDASYAKASLSNRPDLCEYQCNGCMAAAKAYKKKPFDIAAQITDEVSDNDLFESIEAVMPGFINIKINKSFLAEYMNTMISSPKLGLEEVREKKTVMIDYGGPNVAKPLHVGHLRSAIIGESIKRTGRFLGINMISDIHLGDWGLQIGLIIEELKSRQPDLVYFDESYTGAYPTKAPFTIAELEDIYPSASARSKEDTEFKERAQEATFKLQNGYVPYREIWKHIMQVSLADLKNNYKKLNVDFDLWKGESDAQAYIPSLIQELINQGLAYESDGALVVDIAMEGDAKELPPCLVRKSDGAALYATSDLGTIIEREKLYSPDEYIYVADKRQELHFTQVFRVAKKAGIVSEDKPMKFLGFGTMNGKDGKPFKTRDGGVMRLETLILDIDNEVYNRIMENRSVSEEEARATSRIVGLAALKYGDLSNQASKDYVFDIDRFISFEGNTGPYILYTIVRIKSILEKYAEQFNDNFKTYKIINADSDAEKLLMLELSKYNDVIPAAFDDIAPHRICQYIYDLSNAFNRFYHDTKILAEEDKDKRESYVALIILVKDVLEICIELLGFEAPNRM